MDDPPPLARVASVEAQPIPVAGGTGFSILASASSEAATAPVSVDTATCAACLAEVDDPARSPLPLPVHQLHGLRTQVHDHPLRALRPVHHDDGRLHDVPGVPGGVRRPLGPTVPRPAQRVPRVRSPALVDPPRGRWRSDGPRRRSPGRGGRCAPRRRDRRRQGDRWLPPRRRRHRRGGCGRAPAPQGARRQAVRGDGAEPGGGEGAVCAERCGRRSAHVHRVGRSCWRRDDPVRRWPGRLHRGCPTSASSSRTRRCTTCSWRASAEPS